MVAPRLAERGVGEGRGETLPAERRRVERRGTDEGRDEGIVRRKCERRGRQGRERTMTEVWRKD
jgi:hypothetical protein